MNSLRIQSLRAVVVGAVISLTVGACGSDDTPDAVTTETEQVHVVSTEYENRTVTKDVGPDSDCRDYVERAKEVAAVMKNLLAVRAENDGFIDELRAQNTGSPNVSAINELLGRIWQFQDKTTDPFTVTGKFQTDVKFEPLDKACQ